MSILPSAFGGTHTGREPGSVAIEMEGGRRDGYTNRPITIERGRKTLVQTPAKRLNNLEGCLPISYEVILESAKSEYGSTSTSTLENIAIIN